MEMITYICLTVIFGALYFIYDKLKMIDHEIQMTRHDLLKMKGKEPQIAPKITTPISMTYKKKTKIVKRAPRTEEQRLKASEKRKLWWDQKKAQQTNAAPNESTQPTLLVEHAKQDLLDKLA